MDISGTNLTMIQGDSETLIVTRKGTDGLIVVFNDGDTIHFTVKTELLTDEIVLQKIVTAFPEGKAYIELEPEDTGSIIPQRYFYDIQLTTASGRVLTLVKPSKRTLKVGVTNG